METLVWVTDLYPAEAKVSVLDSVVQEVMLQEGLRIHKGRVPQLNEHISRY